MTQDFDRTSDLDDEALGWGESSAPTTNTAPVSEPAQLLDTESTMTPDATGHGPDHQLFDEAGLLEEMERTIPTKPSPPRNIGLVRNAFPTAPAPVGDVISCYINARECLERYKFERPLIEKDGGHGTALTRACLEMTRKAYDFAQMALFAADVTMYKGKVKPCFCTADGMIAGTSNDPAIKDTDGFAVLEYTSRLRQQLLKQAPALKVALVEVEHVAPLLPVEGVTALSAAGWAEFCKRLDVFNVVCTKALIWALKCNCPNYPVPLGTATDSH